MRLASL